jgi:hypothetical protein
MLIFAIIGWVLFAVALTFYVVGTRMDVRDENALAVYALCVVFSEKFRAPIADGLGRSAVQQLQSKKPEEVMFLMMKTIKHFAIKHYLPNAELSTIQLGEELVGSLSEAT